jgi:transcription elongation factor GreA
LKDIILTREGYTKLKREIEDLSTRRRREVAERIKVAREFGDIAENAEYDAAKNEQAMLEARIMKLEERLASARVIEKRRSRRTSSPSARRFDCAMDAKQTVEYRITAPPKRIPPTRSCRTSRRSARRSSVTRRARRSRS